MSQQVFEKDVLEVSDTMQKANIYAENPGIVVKVGLGKSWLPLALAWQKNALKIVRMNHSLDALSYLWLRCRAVDLTVLTMHVMEKEEKETVKIQGLEDNYLVMGEYRKPKNGGHEIGWYAGWKGREIIHKVLVKFQLEPAWDRVEKSMMKFYYIPHPKVYTVGRKQPMLEPDQGTSKSWETFRARRKDRRMFLAGKTKSDVLTDTHLATYPWIKLNVHSTLANHPGDRMEKYSLDPKNQILAKHALLAPVKDKERETRPRQFETYYNDNQDWYQSGMPAKHCRRASGAGYRERERESSIIVTRIFLRTESAPPTKRTALDQIELQTRSVSSGWHKADRKTQRSRDDSSHPRNANRKSSQIHKRDWSRQDKLEKSQKSRRNDSSDYKGKL